MNYAIDHCEPFDQKKENPWMKAEHVGRYLFCADFFKGKKAKKLLDVACAEGFGSQILMDHGSFVFGADINPEYIRTARSRCKEGSFVVMDFDHDDFPASFAEADGAACFETVEHVIDGGGLLRKLSRCIKQDGYLILSFPNSTFEKIDAHGCNYDPFHQKIYMRDEMLQLIGDAGLVLEGEFGQTLCNLLFAAECDAVDSGRLVQAEIDGLFQYNRTAITRLAKLIGYPTQYCIEKSYSYIWILKKVKNM